MEVNNLLCVGRSRLSQFGKANLSNSGFRTPDSSEINSESGFSENELIARMSSKLSSRSASPPTKSILRGKVPSPKHGSPSSLRNVRFSDKDSDDEILYAKIHINKNIQTESPHSGNKIKEAQMEGKHGGLKLQFTESLTESKRPDVHEIKTSTPRYSEFEETPSLDFHIQREREEKVKCLQKSPRVEQSEISRESNHVTVTKVKKHSEHERIVIDIDIDRKQPSDDRTNVYDIKLPTRTEHKSKKKTADIKSDGNNILRNMNVNVSARSRSPERTKPSVPDGNIIIQNMELNSSDIGTKFKSTASQTSGSEASSPRSASPETPYSNRNLPDGSKIIKNMDLSLPHSSLNMKSESVQTIEFPDGNQIIRNLELGLLDSSRENKNEYVQTVDIPDGKKITQNMELSSSPITGKAYSVQVQTLDPQELNQQQFRSVPIQTESASSEKDSHNDSFDGSESRSVGVQAPEPIEPQIPDGSQIIRNMEIQKVEKPKSYTESSNEHRSLNDGNWNEFVRHLELFNPDSLSSSSSVSVSGDEPPTTPISEPVLVYDRKAPSPQTVSSSPPSDERSARTFLESEAFTRQQYESVLREGGLLSKLESSLKQSADASTAAKPMAGRPFEKINKSLNIPTANTVKAKSGPKLLRNHDASEQSTKDTIRNKSEAREPLFSKTDEYYLRKKANDDIKIQEDKRYQDMDREKLGFTPIETYSFNPETLVKTASNRAYSLPKQSVVGMHSRLSPKTSAPINRPFSSQLRESPNTSAAMNKLSSSQVTESVSKNAFVQGLDLGPVPNSAATPRYSSSFAGATRTSSSYKPVQDTTSSYKANSTRYGSQTSSKLQDDFTASAPRSFRSSSLSGLTDRASFPIYNRPAYPHVTGHTSTYSVPAYRTTQRYQTSQYRPSSAPVSRSKLHPKTPTLTTSLRDMRSSMVRKSAMSHFSDHKKNSADYTDTLWSKPTSSYEYQLDSRAARHQTSSEADIFRRSEAIQSYRQVPSRSSNYLSKLNDKSNSRPSSRERSRSRSPMPTARSAYDKRYSEIKQSAGFRENSSRARGFSTDTNFEGRRLIEKLHDSHGNFESVVSRGIRTKPQVETKSSGIFEKTESKPYSTERESRSFTRKPPLPPEMKTPRSSKCSRSRSRSADRKAEQARKQTKEVDVKQGHVDTTINRSKQVSKPELTDTEVTKSRESLSHATGLVTVGTVPSGLVDSDCMYLGHDTIQKIIVEAKL